MSGVVRGEKTQTWERLALCFKFPPPFPGPGPLGLGWTHPAHCQAAKCPDYPSRPTTFPAPSPPYSSATLSLTHRQSQDPERGVGPGQGVEGPSGRSLCPGTCFDTISRPNGTISALQGLAVFSISILLKWYSRWSKGTMCCDTTSWYL